MSASFLARLQGLIWRSRFKAAPSESHSSEYTSSTGSRERVYVAPEPAVRS